MTLEQGTPHPHVHARAAVAHFSTRVSTLLNSARALPGLLVFGGGERRPRTIIIINNIISVVHLRNPRRTLSSALSFSVVAQPLSFVSRLTGGAGLPHGASSSFPGEVPPPQRPKSVLAELADEENGGGGGGATVNGRSGGGVKSGERAAKAAAAVVLGGAALFAAAAVAPPPLGPRPAVAASSTAALSTHSTVGLFHKLNSCCDTRAREAPLVSNSY